MTATALKYRLRRKLRYWFSKWTIANAANRSGRTCWADLVGYAMREKTGERDYDDQYKLRNSLSGGAECREESTKHRDLSCYCGKFTNGCLTKSGQTPGDTSFTEGGDR